MNNKYRIQTYKDGNGKLYYRPQEKALWFFWVDIIECKFNISTLIERAIEFKTYKEAQSWVDNRIHMEESLKRNTLRIKI